MGSSNTTALHREEQQQAIYYHNVLFLQERERTTGFHFHADRYECFAVRKMPAGLVSLGYTTLTCDEVDGAMRDNRHRMSGSGGGCYPPLCWTRDKLLDLGILVLGDMTNAEVYNKLYYGVLRTDDAASACPLRGTSS